MAGRINQIRTNIVESPDPEKITLMRVIQELTDCIPDAKKIEIDDNVSAAESLIRKLTLAQKNLFYVRTRVHNLKQNIQISRKNKKTIKIS